MTGTDNVCGSEHLRRNLLILHAVTEDSPWCASCIRETSTAFERLIQVEVFEDRQKNDRQIKDFSFVSRAQTIIKQSKEPWILLLYGNIGLEQDFLTDIQQQLIKGNGNPVIYSEKSMTDDTIIYMPKKMKYVPYDVLGKFPSNLLIRKTLLEEILNDLRGNFLPNPILGILRILINRGIDIEGNSQIGVIHNALMNCIVGHCGLYEWNRQGNKKRLLVLTHELTRTGAPIVLQEACERVLKPAEYELFVVSPVDGPMMKDYLQANIPVMIIPSLLNMGLPHMSMIASTFDLVIANTNVLWAPICVLNTMNVPVMWWIHDAESGYQWVAPYMPEKLKEHIRVYCVGQYAGDALKKYKPLYNSQNNMIYGIEDQGERQGRLFYDGRSGRCRFICSGSLVERKGQDVLCEAINLLTDHEREKCQFIIVGKSLDPKMKDIVLNACKIYADCMEYCEEIPRNEVYQLYSDADCIICASKDDPMPTFVAEGMMFGTPSICSENTGTAKLLKHGIDGLVYENNDPMLLAEAIRKYLALSTEQKAEMSKKARESFLREFEIEGFKHRFLEAVESCIENVR